jgi:hypothetical protein
MVVTCIEGLPQILAESSSWKMPVEYLISAKDPFFKSPPIHRSLTVLQFDAVYIIQATDNVLKKLKNRDELSVSRSVRFHLLVQMFRNPINRRPLCLQTV